MSQANFDKVDNAAKRLGLTNNDISILLQVTPAMISRYRNDASNIGTRGDPSKLKRAAQALKLVRMTGVKEIRQMTPQERAAMCVAAVQEVDPNLELIKAPMIL